MRRSLLTLRTTVITKKDSTMKPLGYFTSAMPNDGSLLDEMQETWGSTFTALNNAHRLYMIIELAKDLNCDEDQTESERDNEVVAAMERRQELSSSDKIGLMEALINQIKYPQFNR